MRTCLCLCLVLLVAGCATTREVTITTSPPDATLEIDGQDRGRGPVTERFVFTGADDVHRVVARRPGYAERLVELQRDFDRDELHIQLEHESREITFRVRPVAGLITINGRPLSENRLREAATRLRFTLDEEGEWTSYEVRAERPGFAPATETVRWTDDASEYVLELQPMRKDVSITTDPPGARVFLDGEFLGVSPLVEEDRPFPFDPESEDWTRQRVRVERPGYDPVERNISWDDGRTDYHVEMIPHTKTVRIVSDPPGARVFIDDEELDRDTRGVTVAELKFPPIDEEGTLRTYNAVATRETADSEWHPVEFEIGWEDGRSEYFIEMEEVLTRPVDLLVAEPRRTDDGWQFFPRRSTTLAMKDVTEGPQRESPVRLTRLQAGTVIDTLTVSPDGRQVLFTVLLSDGDDDIRSQMITVQSDGTGGASMLTDGRTLDLTPSYTPDGEQILFASNRAGRRMAIWGISATGAPGATQYTVGDSSDLWPTIDSDPEPRLYYQALLDNRPDPRLYMSRLGTTTRTDLTHFGGTQPRVSPKADAVVFAGVNPRTGHRDIYMMADRGGVPQNLTNSPDSDEFDPAWSADGSKVAFVSDRGLDAERRRNYDIWILDLNQPDRLVQLTTNGSWDDRPVWSPDGDAVYFRSNRGGGWNVWRIDVR